MKRREFMKISALGVVAISGSNLFGANSNGTWSFALPAVGDVANQKEQDPSPQVWLFGSWEQRIYDR